MIDITCSGVFSEPITAISSAAETQAGELSANTGRRAVLRQRIQKQFLSAKIGDYIGKSILVLTKRIPNYTRVLFLYRARKKPRNREGDLYSYRRILTWSTSIASLRCDDGKSSEVGIAVSILWECPGVFTFAERRTFPAPSSSFV